MCSSSKQGVDAKAVGLGALNNFTVNQPEGHKGRVKVLSWNDRYEKLTSSDETGFTIVWILHNGQWLEEMVNRHSGSVVGGMCWNSDGQKICIVYEDGTIIVGSVDDIIRLDTGMKIVDAQWNHCGSVLAIACCQQINSSQNMSAVQFYSPFGEHLRTLSLASKQLLGLAWDGTGCRIALALDTLVLFANVRPEYKWAYVRNTLVYAYTRRENAEHCVTFWNTKNGDKTSKFVLGLRGMSACDDVCLLSAFADNSQEMYKLLLCNDIGTQLDCKYVDIEPCHIAVTGTHVVVASRTEIYVWHYRVARRLTAMDVQQGAKPRWDGREKVYHIDHGLSSSDCATSEKKASTTTKDPICCIAALDKTLIVVGLSAGGLPGAASPSELFPLILLCLSGGGLVLKD
uniref:Uncharacterized protein n=1 Tax=Eptatretus burgeri TaxID=7764 RepID=A0A8C4WUA3_EPTBU